MELLKNIWELMLLLAPWLLLGMAIAGGLHVFLPEGFIRKHLGGNGLSGVLKAVAIGVPMPLCSCGVIPAAIGLKKDGASNGAAAGFLISTPQTGIDSILVSASFLGWPFAIFKVFSALVSGLIGGVLVNLFDKGLKTESANPIHSGKKSCCCQASEESKGNETPGGCCSEKAAVEKNSCCGGDETRASQAEAACCSSKVKSKPSQTIAGQFYEAFHFAFVVLLKDIYRWLIVGIIVAALISTLVPEGRLAEMTWTQGLGGMLAMLMISLPMYICATASVPLAASLVLAGMSPGSALVLLMAGPTTNAATMGAIYRAFGRQMLTIYLLTVAVMSIGLGLVFDRIIKVQPQELMHCHDQNPIQWICAVVLSVILAGYVAWDIKAFLAKRGDTDSCCH